MASNDLEDLGEAIKGLIQDAIDSNDFKRLSQSITSIFKGTTRTQNNYYKTTQDNYYLLFSKTTRYKTLAILFMIFGYSNAFMFGITTLFILLASILTSDWFVGLAIAVIFGLITLVFGLIGYKGTSMYNMTRRFRGYIRGLGGKTYGEVKQLSYEVNKPINFVRDDLKKMIHKGWFLQGHLDRKGKTLIVSNDTYNEYLRTLNQNVQPEVKEEKKKNVNNEAKDIIDAGNDFILKIHESNERIPGEEISIKIEKMENIIKKIFKRVEQHPENIEDIRKLMKYYLPTTIKLLNAYEELDQQDIQGENIENSKREIEQTIDTLNKAFSKLLDDLFRETAWDISSDASVIESLLKQDGLYESELK